MIPARLRRTIRLLYGGSCGYCGVAEDEVGAVLTIDHYQPKGHGGTDSLENLVYCCPACNAFKSDFWSEHPEERLLHPLYEDPGAHWREEANGVLAPLTEAGERQITRLHLNRPALVRHRLRVRERRLERYTQAELQRQLTRIERRVRRLEQRFEEE